MNWLLFEDKMIALDKFNTILNPIMIYIVILLLSIIIIGFYDFMIYNSSGDHILNTKIRNIIKVVFLLILILIILVGITNSIEYYSKELMEFDGYMYIDYKKQIIEIQK